MRAAYLDGPLEGSDLPWTGQYGLMSWRHADPGETVVTYTLRQFAIKWGEQVIVVSVASTVPPTAEMLTKHLLTDYARSASEVVRA